MEDGEVAETVCGFGDSLDLNVAAIGHSEFPDVGCAEFESAYDRTDSNGRKRKRDGDGILNCRVFKAKSITRGSIVKGCGAVLRMRNDSLERRPNVICRVESFGKICGSFDERGKKWVREMGFGGLLYLVNMHLPRALCYWLMTRIDPDNEMLVVCGKQYRISEVQVRWILGLPKGINKVPSDHISDEAHRRVLGMIEKYGQVWTSVEGSSAKVVRRPGISTSSNVVERLMSNFDDEEADEFKTLFLMAAIDMVLCPTQCTRFSKDLLPAVGCAIKARDYNWCALVVKKLMASATRFGRRFNAEGYAGGCGGCTLFVAILYLDRLDRNALHWGSRPRIKVWNDTEIKKACHDDRSCSDGDFESAGVLDVAYGEMHPREARDLDFSSEDDI